MRVTKPGLPEPPTPGGHNRVSQTFVILAGILSDIGLGAIGRKGNDSNERLYRRVKKELNNVYAKVSRDCESMAHIQSSDTLESRSCHD